MYIVKNALKCISRAKGRNILIGIIALVIAVSACIGLSIRQAAESTKGSTLENLTVTAAISFDRQSMMSGLRDSSKDSTGGFDHGQFSSMMGSAASLTLEDYQTYAAAESVKDFYYTQTVSLNGSEAFAPVSTESDTETASAPDQEESGFGGRGNAKGGMGSSSDFTVIGYSGENAMTAFLDGTAAVTDGEIFPEGTTDMLCLISEELAIYNDLAVGDTVVLTNPDSETETYELTVVGIYTGTETNTVSMFDFGSAQDPANRIYMSAPALQSILDASKSLSAEQTAAEDGTVTDTSLTGTISATYVFADPEGYYRFEEEVRALGLDESYTVSSTDLLSYENSLTPLNSLSTMAGWFLVVILAIGAVILIVLNIFNIRERKYEIGVLTAMGMKKRKVALQFITEILVVTMFAVVIGAGIGAVSSVPVTNALLANQVESQQSQQTQVESNFGRGQMNGGNLQGVSGKAGFSDPVNYITQVNSAMNLTVVLQMICIGLLLTLAAGAVSVLFVMRYDPLKILANRD